MLMPGAYQHQSFLEETAKKKVTYNFQGIERDEGPKIGHGYGDKVPGDYLTLDVVLVVDIPRQSQEVATSPGMYDTVDYSAGADEKDTK